MFEYKLNSAQKEAVEYTNGPLLIVAGAGTGKTTVITNKICYLIEKGLAKPEEILALTFTEKAANEMQERVDKLINAGYAEMHISTFHTFCQRILERHAIDIGLSNQFKLLTETAAWILVRQHFSKFNLDYYRPMGNPIRHIHELLKHFSKCKDELITPQEYLEYAEGLKLNGDSENQKIKKTKKQLKNEGLRMKNEESINNRTIEQLNNNEADIPRLTEVANSYHTYNQLLLDNAMFDFGDLIFYTCKLFSERPAVLQKFQQQFKYILVDEFQDVNWAQYRLVQLLSNVDTNVGVETRLIASLRRPQLTVVGDDDQSIYAFRGASVSNILRFKDDYPKAKEIVLNENYRSNQEILDEAYESIQNNNPDRLEVKLKIDKKLKARKPEIKKTKKQIDTVAHVHSGRLDEEVQSVVDEIVRLKETGKDTTWDDFAILVRANNHADPFLSALETKGIPYEFLASSGLYHQSIIIDCVNYLKLIGNHYESASLFRLLCLPFLEFKESDLQKITYNAKKKSISYYETLKRAAEFGVSEEGIGVCNKLIETIHDGMKRARHEKASIILYSFLEKIGYLKYLTQQEGEGNREVIRQIYHLKQFFEYLSEFETLNPGAHVADFLEHFQMILDAGDKGSLYQPSDTPDSVNISTIHAAKGLEFKYVFVVNLVEDRFPSRSRGDGIEIPTELIKEQLPEGNSHEQEERRLFYVAVTRAKERLYFTSASDYGGARTKKISRFLAELGYTVKDIEKEKPSIPEKKRGEPQKGKFVFELPKAFSFSQIRSYETCPYQYKLAHILDIPGKGNASFSFGQTMHSTLQAFYQRVQELNAAEQVSLFASQTITVPVGRGGGTPPLPTIDPGISVVRVPPLEDLLSLYEKYWIPDWYRTQNQREEY